MPQTAATIKHQVNSLKNANLAKDLMQFFQTHPGGYGAGDKFLGVRVPALRKIAKQNSDLAMTEIKKLADSKFHEERFLALAIMVLQFKNTTDQRAKKLLFDAYLRMVKAKKIVNNWDLVDVSAPYFGEYLIKQPEANEFLIKLVKNKDLWVQRVAMLFTFAFIKAGNNKPTLLLAKELLSHPHDLMHKAAGWMLREAGKKNLKDLIIFLEAHATAMPRTMLRYSIEKLPQTQRKKWLAKR
jgi:3-methyladenine DNA glycosylase AlkD